MNDDDTAAFELARPRLFGIAYRMLGCAAEAEDVVQDVWLKWHATDRTAVRNSLAFLTTVTTRSAINVTQSARVRRESYIGPWLPEPIDTRADPAMGAASDAAVELAVLVVLERLPARERAAYVLREAFDYPYGQIADIVETTETNARQLVTRARRHLADARPTPVDSDHHHRLLDAFLAAAKEGDLAALEKILAQDVVSLSDGGGKVNAAARIPVAGRSRVATFIAAFSSHFWTGATTTFAEVNGRAAVLITRDAALSTLLTIDAFEDGIGTVLRVMNPEKLNALSR
ncbi:RNA polymerase sigma-70 factor [Rhodococcus sp. IEGM 1381]|uniref:RNA polymerase sigma-70 factor n=1 Tax=Rhodococcus sp. IEGM 1381 TaxID=3047085 RepID=UPI0024B83332|nr:RNA polymerase sigma-70 factor [Rhodococcus sp. IEGM 1381]MDI9893271.1 RNA polymerase sigma-70 factor [Rhodococcus sp. IEGM 1381]